MPKVNGRKPSKTKTTRSRSRAKKPQRGALEGAGAQLDTFLQRAFNAAVTYTAVFAVGLVLVVVLMLFAGGYFVNIGGRLGALSQDMARGIGLEVTRVTLSGATQTAEREILSALYDERDGQIVGRSLLHVSPHRALADIEQLGWVRYAAVSRLWPNTIHVSIEERIPAALWQREGSGRLYLIDREGAVIDEVGGHQYTGLPLITDTQTPGSAQDILAVLARYPDLAAQIGNLRSQGGRRWDMTFRNGFVVKLPERDFAAAIEKVDALERDGKLAAELKHLDLRDPRTVYYSPRQE